MNISKKIITFITIFSLVFGVQLSQPRQVYAVFGVGDTTIDVPQLLKEFGIDTLVTILQSRMIEKMVGDTLNWAVGGFDGEPGFIENYEDFLKDAGQEVLTGAFQNASKFAASSLGGMNGSEYILTASSILQSTALQGYDMGVYGAEFNEAEFIGYAQKAIQYAAVYGTGQLDLESEGAYSQCLESAKSQYNIDKTNTCVAWGTQLSTPTQAELDAGEVAENVQICTSWDFTEKMTTAHTNAFKKCEGVKAASSTGTAVLGSLAELNYQELASGNMDARQIAQTIGGHAAKSLNFDEVTSLIEGKGETLSKLLGGQDKKKEFANDITVGGWAGYIALADPHNYEAGLSSLVTNAIDQKVAKKTNIIKDDLKTDTKTLDKKECADKSTPDAQGKCKDDRNPITITPASTTDAKTEEANNSEVRQSQMAKELSDVLAKTLGKVAMKLISAGLSKLGNKTKTGAQLAEKNPLSGTYQNNYDILGITNDTDNVIGFGAISGSGASAPGVNGDGYVDIYSNDPSIPFIGGPEDVDPTDGPNEGVELVINLQEKLEVAYETTKLDIELQEKVQAVILKMKDDAMILDRCTPGPDFGWQDRFKDLLDVSEVPGGDEDEKGSAASTANAEMIDTRLNKIAFNEMRLMVNDPKVNIPGARKLNGIISNSMGDSSISQFKALLNGQEEKKNILYILEEMKSVIQSDFNTYKTGIHPKLPIFMADWDDDPKDPNDKFLTNTEKLEIFSLRAKDVDGNFITTEIKDSLGNVTGTKPVYLFDKYYLLKTDETRQQVLTNNPDRVRQAVISYSWDLWRTQKGLESSGTGEYDVNGKKQKSNLRYQFYIIENNISRQAQIVEMETRLQQMERNRQVISDYMSDCLTFRANVTGFSPMSQYDEKSKTGQLYEKGTYKINVDIIGTIIAMVIGGGPGSPTGGVFTDITQAISNNYKSSNGGKGGPGTKGALPYAPMIRISLNKSTNYVCSKPECKTDDDFKTKIKLTPAKNVFELSLASNALTDAEIITHLKTQEALYLNPTQKSIYKTPVFFDYANSILGFENMNDKIEYFRNKYPILEGNLDDTTELENLENLQKNSDKWLETYFPYNPNIPAYEGHDENEDGDYEDFQSNIDTNKREFEPKSSYEVYEDMIKIITMGDISLYGSQAFMNLSTAQKGTEVNYENLRIVQIQNVFDAYSGSPKKLYDAGADMESGLAIAKKYIRAAKKTKGFYHNISTDYSNFLGNADTVTEIFKQDYTGANFPSGGVGTGYLFCRIRTSFDGDKFLGKQWVSNCLQDWYTASSLDYTVWFSGI